MFISVERSGRVRELRQWILGAVIGSGFLLIGSGFSGGMWVILHHLGDEIGARAAWGTAGVSAAGFVVAHILLVTLLALAFLQRNMEREPIANRPPRL